MYVIQILKNEWNEVYRIIVSTFPKKCILTNTAITWFHDIDLVLLSVQRIDLVLLSVQRRDRNRRVPNLCNCPNIEGKEKGGHASDVHCAAIF
jgi:hypothetical protein